MLLSADRLPPPGRRAEPFGGGFDQAIVIQTFLALLVLVFSLQFFLLPGLIFIPGDLAFVPGTLFGGVELSGVRWVIPPPATLVTYQFLHASGAHLFGNLVFLGLFGPRIECTLGSGPTAVLLLFSGVVAGLFQALPEPSSAIPMVGASGSICGLLGAYLWLHPRAEIRLPLGKFFPQRGWSVPAWVVLGMGLWVQVLSADWTGTVPGGVAYRAHLGGFLAGLLLAAVLNWWHNNFIKNANCP